MNSKNTYREFDEYAANLIKHKARKMVGTAGYTSDDLHDIEQDLMLDLLQRIKKYNPAIAKMTTFMSRIVDNKANTLYESRNAARRNWKLCQTSLNDPIPSNDSDIGERIDLVTSPREEDESMSPIEIHDRHMDLAKALSSLPEDLQDLCQRLKYLSITEAAQELGIPRTSLYTKLKQLRQHFSDSHLEDYLQPRHLPENSGKKPTYQQKHGAPRA